jgi:hypothetical protein
MTILIAPLYFSKTDELLFGMTDKFSRTYAYYPNSVGFFEFWDPIMASMHLAPPSLFSALEEFFDARDTYWDNVKDPNTLDYIGSCKRFEDTRSALSTQIDIAYKDLSKKLRPPDITAK